MSETVRVVIPFSYTTARLDTVHCAVGDVIVKSDVPAGTFASLNDMGCFEPTTEPPTVFATGKQPQMVNVVTTQQPDLFEPKRGRRGKQE